MLQYAMKPKSHSLMERLRGFRSRLRLSQLELSLRLGISQRHVSFVESGRSQPSRMLLLSWLRVLQVPLVQSNETLIAAGYAPEYPASTIDDPSLASAKQALNCLLEAHDPVPAFVLDETWNIQAMNKGAIWLAQTLIPSLIKRLDPKALNMLDLFIDPDGLSPLIINIDDVGPRFLSMLEIEAVTQKELTNRVKAFKGILSGRIGASDQSERGIHLAPALTTVFTSPYGELAFMSMFTTFGTPQDITLASLRVEHLFPADEATISVLNKHVA